MESVQAYIELAIEAADDRTALLMLDEIKTLGEQYGWISNEEMKLRYASSTSFPSKDLLVLASPKTNINNYSVQGYIWLSRDSHKVCLMNVIPYENFTLDKTAYNAIVIRFNDEIACSLTHSVEVVITEDFIPLNALMDEDCLKLLLEFIGAANYSEGNRHSLDMDRWNKFIIVSFNTKSQLQSNLLRDYFESLNKFEDVIVDNLIHDYEYGLKLLSAYESI